MGLFWLAAIAAAKKANSHKYRSHRHSNKNDSGGEKSESQVEVVNYLACLFKELSYDNPKLLSFFESISDEYKIVAEEEISRLKEEAEKDFKKSTEKKVYFLKLKEALENESINVELRLKDEIDSIYMDEVVSFYFNGYDIPFEYFLGKNFSAPNSRRWNLNNFKSDRDNYESKISELKLHLEEIQKKFHLLPSKRKEAKQKIGEIQGKIDDYLKKHDDVCKKIELYEKIDNLPDEIKKLILNSIEETNERLKLRKNALIKLNTIQNLKKQYNYVDYVLKITMEKMTKEGKITEDILEKVFLQMDKVEIKGRRGEYNFRSWSSRLDYKAENLKGLLIWFIKNVYEIDENFVNSNYDLEQEETKNPTHK